MKVTVEDKMRSALTHMHALGYSKLYGATLEAVVDEDADADGKLDDNTDLGAGAEPGEFTIFFVNETGGSEPAIRESEAAAMTWEAIVEKLMSVAEQAEPDADPEGP